MAEKDAIKQAFTKAKQDIFNLQSQIQTMLQEIQEIKRTIRQTDAPDRQTDRQENQTDNLLSQRPVPPILPISTGNQGVQTDRQTIRQTDRQTKKFAQGDKIKQLEKVSEVLESLDTIKKELRSKFKKITDQEMLIFSSIYQLEEQGLTVDYPLISSNTHLSESSIRDYVQKLIQKGIPINKTKENNKKIILSIPQDLKKIATLNTILTLRGL